MKTLGVLAAAFAIGSLTAAPMSSATATTCTADITGVIHSINGRPATAVTATTPTYAAAARGAALATRLGSPSTGSWGDTNRSARPCAPA
jgi:hypothetical protein